MSDQIFVSDIGTEFRVTVIDSGVSVDLSSATSLNLIFKKPDGQILTVAADLWSDGTDGIIYYNTVSGDIDQSGLWKIEVFVAIGSQEFYSSIGTFKVLCPLS